jgi:hypothetical protein
MYFKLAIILLHIYPYLICVYGSVVTWYFYNHVSSEITVFEVRRILFLEYSLSGLLL